MKIRSLCMPAATLLVMGMMLVACMPVSEAVPSEGTGPVDTTQMLGGPPIPPVGSTEGIAQQAAPSPASIEVRAEVGEPPIPPSPPTASTGEAVQSAEAPPRDQATPLPAPTDGNSTPDNSSIPPEVGTVESAPLDVPPQPPHDLPPATAIPASTSEPPASIAADPTPGTLDTSFGDAGKVTTDFAGDTDTAYAVAIQADGKLVVGGWAQDDPGEGDFAVARYNTDGSLDPSFGSGGLVITVLDYGFIFDLAIQPDGKIVVVGRGGIDGVYGCVLVRYDEYGVLDPSFGDAGRVVAAFDPSSNSAGLALVIQPDGKLVVAGDNGGSSGFDFVVARFNPDGSLDTGFGTGGIVVTDFGAHDMGWGIGIQSDGKIVVAGDSYEYVTSDCDFALARYNTDGSLDTDFGTGGKVLTAFGTIDYYKGGLAIQPDDKIIVAGGRDHDFALVRYNSNGSLDTTFGTDGKVTTDFSASNDLGFAIALRADGKIIVAGASYTGSEADFALACYNPDGSLDTGFGSGGKVTTDFNALDDRAFDVALQADGKIVAAGSALDGQERDFALARYHAPADIGTPVVSIASPLDGSTVFGMVPVQVMAVDDVDPPGTLAVEVSDDGGSSWELATWSASGYYEYNWNTRTHPCDKHVALLARATDSESHVTTSSPVWVTVKCLSPADPPQFIIEGSSVQVVVSGYLPDSCSRLNGIEQIRDGDRVEVWVYIHRPHDVFCLQAITPFEKVITLDGEFLPGDYVLVLNGVEYPFTVP